MVSATTRDEDLPIGATYAACRQSWARQVRSYARSVRLYQQLLTRQQSWRTPARYHEPELLRPASYTSAAAVSTPRLQIVDVIPAVTLLAVAIEPDLERSTVDAQGSLTRRQFEIALLIAQGLTNSQIATRIVVSRGTVGNHIGQMLRRLGVNNRAQIAAWAIQHPGR